MISSRKTRLKKLENQLQVNDDIFFIFAPNPAYHGLTPEKSVLVVTAGTSKRITMEEYVEFV